MAKILILANNDLGLYKFRKELIKELLKDNEVYISLPDGDFVRSLESMGCKFIDTAIDRRGINPINDIRLVLKYFKIMRMVKPGLTITYTVKPNIYGGIVSRINSIPYAINITGLGTAFQKKGILKLVIISLYRVACKRVRVVFFENDDNQNTFVRYKIIDKLKTCKLNGAGVNLDEYSFADYPQNDEKIRFLFIGRVMKEKGIAELIEAANRIKNEYENVDFDIVGPFEENYYNQIEKLDTLGIIKFHGFQKDVKPFIEKAHCFIFPSHHEGMANTLLECAAMGRPLITSDIPGCKEAVIDGKNGYLTDVNNSEYLYSNLLKFMNLTYAEKSKMGFQSREHIEKLFDKTKVIKITIRKLNL